MKIKHSDIVQTFNLIDALTAIENISVVLRFTKKTRKEAFETPWGGINSIRILCC